MLVPVNAHAVGKERIQPHHTPHAVPDYLRKRISPQEKVNHGRLSKYERGHFGVGRIVEKKIERMPRHTLFPVPSIFVNMNRQPRDGLRQNADASVNRRGLRREASPLGHGCKLVDLGSGGRLAENERPAAEVVAVLGLVP